MYFSNIFILHCLFQILLAGLSIEESKFDDKRLNYLLKEQMIDRAKKELFNKIIHTNADDISLDVNEAYDLICCGLTFFRDHEVTVASLLIRYFASNEQSFNNLYIKHFETFIDEFLRNDNNNELKREILSAIKTKSYDEFKDLRRKIYDYLRSQNDIKLQEPPRNSLVFEDFLVECKKFVKKRFQICFKIDRKRTNYLYKFVSPNGEEHLFEFRNGEDHCFFLQEFVLNVELFILYDRFTYLSTIDTVFTGLQDCFIRNMIISIDSNFLLESEFFTIKTIKYIEHMDKFCKSNHLFSKKIFFKYRKLIFSFDEKNSIEVTNFSEKVMFDCFPEFIRTTFDFTNKINDFLVLYKSIYERNSIFERDNVFLNCLRSVFAYLSNFIEEKIKIDNQQNPSENTLSKYPFISMSSEMTRYYEGHLQHSWWFKEEVPNHEYTFVDEWLIKPFHTHRHQSVSSFLILSNDYLLFASSDKKENVALLSNDFSEGEFDELQLPATLRYSIIVDIISKYTRGQVFNTLYFDNLPDNSVVNNINETQSSIFLKISDDFTIFRIKNCKIRLKSLQKFAPAIEFYNCEILPYDQNIDFLLVTNNAENSPYQKNVLFTHCQFDNDVFFEESILKVDLYECKTPKIVSLSFQKSVSVTISKKYDTETVYELDNLIFEWKRSVDSYNEIVYFFFDKDKRSIELDHLIIRSWFIQPFQFEEILITGVIFERSNFYFAPISSYTSDKKELASNTEKNSRNVKNYTFDLSRLRHLKIDSTVGTILITLQNNIDEFYLILTNESKVDATNRNVQIKNARIIFNGEIKEIESFSGTLVKFAQEYLTS